MPTTQVSDITSYNHHRNESYNHNESYKHKNESYNHHKNATTMKTSLSNCPHCLPPVCC